MLKIEGSSQQSYLGKTRVVSLGYGAWEPVRSLKRVRTTIVAQQPSELAKCRRPKDSQHRMLIGKAGDVECSSAEPWLASFARPCSGYAGCTDGVTAHLLSIFIQRALNAVQLVLGKAIASML
jgi:hypothetical protein